MIGYLRQGDSCDSFEPERVAKGVRARYREIAGKELDGASKRFRSEAVACPF